MPTAQTTESAAPGRRERKRRQQLDHLADVAWQLFESEGYAAVTMERIAAAADVAKGTLYKHFPVKEALLRHRFHRELKQGLADLLPALAARPPGAPRLRAFLETSARWSERHRPYVRPYLEYRLAEPRLATDEGQRSGLEQVFAALIAEGQAAGSFRRNVPAAAAAHYLEFLYLGAVLRWLGDAAPSLMDEMETMLTLFLGGLEAHA